MWTIYQAEQVVRLALALMGQNKSGVD
jgi:hypothetical protein